MYLYIHKYMYIYIDYGSKTPRIMIDMIPVTIACMDGSFASPCR